MAMGWNKLGLLKSFINQELQYANKNKRVGQLMDGY